MGRSLPAGRRGFLVGAGALLLPQWAGAQTPARVGWLTLHSAGMYNDVTSRGFVRGLRESGYEEGRNLVFVRRSAEGDIAKLRALAREIVDAKVDVMFAPAKPMADAAWYASRLVPTVIATVTDPVAVQYAESLARPGKHITGVTTANAELIGKRLQLLTEIIPGLKHVGTFIDGGLLESCEQEMLLLDKSAARLGIRITRLRLGMLKPDVDAAMKQAVAAGVQAVITMPMTTNLDITGRVSDYASKYRIPFVHDVPQLAQVGLATYGPDFEDIFRRAGIYVSRVLKGEKPAAMPIEEPKQFKFILNLRVARDLGLTIPPSVLLRADEVLQ
jgi:putative tryptophan/tyrosine transport system substrate-binding protein